MRSNRDDIRAMVDDYLHDLLTPEDAAYVRDQVGSSRVWHTAMEEAKARFAAMKNAPVAAVPDSLISSTLERVERKAESDRSKSRFLRVAIPAAIAAAVLIIASIHIYFAALSPTPYDLRILGQSELVAGTHGSIRIRLANHSTGEVVVGAPVDIELFDLRTSSSVHLASFATDAHGSGQPRFTLPDWAHGDYELRIIAQPGGKKELLQRTVSLKRSWRLMLSTDKPVYQPGQSILVRSLALRKPDQKPIAGQEVTFAIVDPRGNVVFRQRDVTSRFGIASMECPLATEIIEGAYSIEARLGDTTSKLSVDVKKYVLPKFQVVMNIDKPYYGPGDEVTGTVSADYFFGQPVANAAVAIEIEAVDVQQITIQHPTLQTDDAGRARFELRLPESLAGREQDSGDVRIHIKCTVTDTAGQQHTRRIARVVTARPLRVDLIPESGELVRGLPNTIYLFASYADGTPATARIAVSGLDRELETSELGVASFELTPSTDEVDLSVRVMDADGRIGRERVSLRTGTASGDFILRTDRAVYAGGSTMQVVALGAGSEPIFFDIVKDGQTILVHSVDLQDGRGEYAFDLPPDAFGTLQLSAYRYDGPGLPIRKSRVFYVNQAGELNITATLDRESYRPGRTARLDLRVTDENGRPAPGALSLVAVDEAVFSVRGQSAGMEQAFFTLEQELLRPVYAIYTWTPSGFDDGSELDRRLLEQALFARTMQTGDDRESLLRRLVDDNYVTEEFLAILESPDFEQHVEQLAQLDYFPESVLSVLRGAGAGVYSLRATSYPAKYQQTIASRRSGLKAVKTAWILLGVAVGLIGLAYLFTKMPNAGCTLVALLGGVLLVALLLPALNKARSRAAGVRDQAMVHELGIALEIFEQESGPLLLGQGDDQAGASVRVRQWFPETLLWRPEVITDDSGVASLEIDLADSITTWRLTSSVVSAGGRLGASQTDIRVFQPFFVDLNLPAALTRGDEVSVPVVVYNYLDQPQTVAITLDDAGWFTLLDDRHKELDLEVGAVESTFFRIRVERIGQFKLEVAAQAGDIGDAIERSIEVISDGTTVEQVASGNLQNPAEMDVDIPDHAIEGSVKAIVKIYPSSFSQVVEGLDSIFQRPYGCFEQTSSTTYPNVLALDYLRRTNKTVPAVEAKARQYIHLGYQRLLSFEVSGGGFDWFGQPPANTTLTAYGLMEFQDMAAIHDVDPDLIARTRRWLLDRREHDGSWSAESHRMQEDPTGYSRLSTTAYVAMAVFESYTGPEVAATREALLRHEPDGIQDPHTLALVCNALIAMNVAPGDIRPYLDQLASMREESSDGDVAWWDQMPGARTTFYGAGRSGDIETTALATLAILNGEHDLSLVRAALHWLIEQKDASGTWYSTQATVLALKAILAGTDRPLGADRERRVVVEVDGETVADIVIPKDQGDVVRQLDLSERFRAGGSCLSLTETTDTGAGYQIAISYNVPEKEDTEPAPDLIITVTYDRTELRVADTVNATATVRNNMTSVAPMVILDLPIPGGFAADASELEEMVRAGQVAKYQITPRSIIIYLRQLAPADPLILKYGLRATMPVRLTVPPASAYEYYDPDTRAASMPAQLVVFESM